VESIEAMIRRLLHEYLNPDGTNEPHEITVEALNRDGDVIGEGTPLELTTTFDYRITVEDHPREGVDCRFVVAEDVANDDEARVKADLGVALDNAAMKLAGEVEERFDDGARYPSSPPAVFRFDEVATARVDDLVRRFPHTDRASVVQAALDTFEALVEDAIENNPDDEPSFVVRKVSPGGTRRTILEPLDPEQRAIADGFAWIGIDEDPGPVDVTPDNSRPPLREDLDGERWIEHTGLPRGLYLLRVYGPDAVDTVDTLDADPAASFPGPYTARPTCPPSRQINLTPGVEYLRIESGDIVVEGTAEAVERHLGRDTDEDLVDPNDEALIREAAAERFLGCQVEVERNPDGFNVILRGGREDLVILGTFVTDDELDGGVEVLAGCLYHRLLELAPSAVAHLRDEAREAEAKAEVDEVLNRR